MTQGRNHIRRLLRAATCLATCLATLTAAAQVEGTKSVVQSDPRVARLDKTLASLADESDGLGDGLAVISLVAGVAYAGFGVSLAVDPDQEPRDSSSRGIVVTETLILSGFLLGVGAYGLSSWGSPSPGSHRYARWQRDLRAGKLSHFKLGQYEGELYREAVVARSGRRAGGFLYLGVAAAGAGLIALAATSDLRGEARTVTYVEGAAFLPLGTIAGILMLAGESSHERQWRLYRSGAPSQSVARWSLHPVVTRDGFLFSAGASL